MDLHLKEAKRIINEVNQIFGYLKKFDEEIFYNCLSEEISKSLQLKEPKAVFIVSPFGDVNYEGIFEAVDIKDPTRLVIPIKIETEIKEQTDVFGLISFIKEEYLRKRKKVNEDLEATSELVNKILEDYIKANKEKNKSLVTEAQEFLNLDIATKKQKLLDKLLENKNENSQK